MHSEIGMYTLKYNTLTIHKVSSIFHAIELMPLMKGTGYWIFLREECYSALVVNQHLRNDQRHERVLLWGTVI